MKRDRKYFRFRKDKIDIREWCKFLVCQVVFFNTRIILTAPWKKGVTTVRNRRMAAKRGKPSEFRIEALNGQGVVPRPKNFHSQRSRQP